jgi:hypothetical protein
MIQICCILVNIYIINNFILPDKKWQSSDEKSDENDLNIDLNILYF